MGKKIFYIMNEPPPPVPSVLCRDRKDGSKIRYVLKEKIGSGGFAVVYSAEETPGSNIVAVKCLTKLRLTDPKNKNKLVSEIEIHKALRHPNIVEFKAVFQDTNYVYIILEYCPHGSVLEHFRKNNPYTEEYISKVLFQILTGVDYLHKKLIIHRDIKLQNLLLDENNGIKIADFGLSAKLETIDDKRNTICGTPGYLPPEIVEKSAQGHSISVDIWAIGVCAFLMLTGKHPFNASDKKITFKNISEVNYSWPEKNSLSREALDFVDTSLKRDPKFRPQASDLISHPFILKHNPQFSPPKPENFFQIQQKLPVVPVDDTYSDPITESEEIIDKLPSYAVRIWWDYSEKYGLGYMLHNHVCGACFNDSSRIVMFPDESTCQYWASPQTTEPDVYFTDKADESPIKKKLLLIKHFTTELKKRAEKMLYPPLEILSERQNVSHVKYWARTVEGILFRMANRDIQGNFKDHTKLVIESSTRVLYYDTGASVTKLPLSEIGSKEKYHEVRDKFALVKEMAKELA